VILKKDGTMSQEYETGRLRVGHCTYLPPALLAMVHRLRFTKSEGLRIEHHAGFTGIIAEKVVHKSLDAGFGYLPVCHPELLAFPLYEEPVVACMSTGHILANKPSICPSEIQGLPVIAVGREILPQMHEEVEKFFDRFAIELRIIANAFAPPEAVIMAEHRIGICFVGLSAASRSGTVGKLLSHEMIPQKSGLWVRQKSGNPELKEFIDFVLEESKDLPSHSPNLNRIRQIPRLGVAE
jgi:DNA-binding transcriptional LysR family regulator